MLRRADQLRVGLPAAGDDDEEEESEASRAPSHALRAYSPVVWDPTQTVSGSVATRVTFRSTPAGEERRLVADVLSGRVSWVVFDRVAGAVVAAEVDANGDARVTLSTQSPSAAQPVPGLFATNAASTMGAVSATVLASSW